MILGVVRKIDDEEGMKKDLKRAKLKNYCRCPDCGDMIEKIANIMLVYSWLVSQKIINICSYIY